MGGALTRTSQPRSVPRVRPSSRDGMLVPSGWSRRRPPRWPCCCCSTWPPPQAGVTGAAGGVGEAGGASGHMGGRARSARWFSCTIVRFYFLLMVVVVVVVVTRPASVLRCPSFCIASPIGDVVDIGGQWVQRRQVAALPLRSRCAPAALPLLDPSAVCFAILDSRGMKAWVCTAAA